MHAHAVYMFSLKPLLQYHDWFFNYKHCENVWLNDCPAATCLAHVRMHGIVNLTFNGQVTRYYYSHMHLTPRAGRGHSLRLSLSHCFSRNEQNETMQIIRSVTVFTTQFDVSVSSCARISVTVKTFFELLARRSRLMLA